MSEHCQDSARCRPDESLAIHTEKITDSCRDKDCIEDLRVYLTKGSQALLETASGVRVRSADLLYTYIDVEPVAFDRHHYCIDVTFYYRILADAVIGSGRPATLYGLSLFSKRAVLCGEESKAHIYRSDTRLGRPDGPTAAGANLPTAIVEVLDPMVLGSCVRPVCTECESAHIPEAICSLFDEELICRSCSRQLFVTLGQFSIIRLQRDAQVVVPILEYSMPVRECSDTPGSGEDPCEMFSRIPFPERQFSPRDCDGKCGCNP